MFLEQPPKIHNLNQWGYFAAWDVRSKPYRQITTAVADGTIAAITAVRELESIDQLILNGSVSKAFKLT